MIHPSLLEEKTHDVTSTKSYMIMTRQNPPWNQENPWNSVKNKKENDLPTASQPPVFSASKLFSLIGLSSTSLAVWEASPWKPRSSTALLAVPGNPQRLLLCGGLAPAAEVCWGHPWQLENGGWAVVSGWKMWWCCFFGKRIFLRVKYVAF